MTVQIMPMPEWARKISPKFRPSHPPIFLDCGAGGPSDEERELANELFKILDEESKAWYRSGGLFKDIE